MPVNIFIISVTPAKAGVQSFGQKNIKELDTGFRRYDSLGDRVLDSIYFMCFLQLLFNSPPPSHKMANLSYLVLHRIFLEKAPFYHRLNHRVTSVENQFFLTSLYFPNRPL